MTASLFDSNKAVFINWTNIYRTPTLSRTIRYMKTGTCVLCVRRMSDTEKVSMYLIEWRINKHMPAWMNAHCDRCLGDDGEWDIQGLCPHSLGRKIRASPFWIVTNNLNGIRLYVCVFVSAHTRMCKHIWLTVNHLWGKS